MQSALKILQVHNYYKQRGGEASVIEMERTLLEKNGHVVILFCKDSALESGSLVALKTAWKMPYSQTVFEELSKILMTDQPDIVHVHNTFPLITPSVFYACKKLGIPVVYTLHNYRLIYPNALLMHNGEIDLRTINNSAYSVVKDKVYQNSLMKTYAVSRLIEFHKKNSTWYTQVDKFICLTDFAKRIFMDWGLPENLLAVKPNFVQDPYRKFPDLNPDFKREGFLFVGRISKEKGVEDLIRTWINYDLEIPLNIIGDGELKNNLQEISKKNKYINWIGYQNKENVYLWLTKVKALILPSIWFEGFPMTLAEAMAAGTPSIVSNIGSQHTIIKDGISGLHFNVSDQKDLMEKVISLDENPEQVTKLSEGARSIYLNQFTEQVNYGQLLNIYKSVIN